MIKFAATKMVGGREIPVVGLGLSRENCRRLLLGQPICVSLDELVPSLEAEVILFAGETEEAMAKEFRDKGLIKPGTRTIGMHPDDPHGK
jgi:hypothetical protein